MRNCHDHDHGCVQSISFVLDEKVMLCQNGSPRGVPCLANKSVTRCTICVVVIGSRDDGTSCLLQLYPRPLLFLSPLATVLAIALRLAQWKRLQLEVTGDINCNNVNEKVVIYLIALTATVHATGRTRTTALLNALSCTMTSDGLNFG